MTKLIKANGHAEKIVMICMGPSPPPIRKIMAKIDMTTDQ